MSNSPPPIAVPEVRTVVVRPHRAQKILLLGALGFVFAPCGFAAAWLGKRDLKAMADGSMDRSGEGLTKIGRWLGIIAGIVWAIKWTILTILIVLIYYSWEAVSKMI